MSMRCDGMLDNNIAFREQIAASLQLSHIHTYVEMSNGMLDISLSVQCFMDSPYLLRLQATNGNE
jgi:hypothetical protein